MASEILTSLPVDTIDNILQRLQNGETLIRVRCSRRSTVQTRACQNIPPSCSYCPAAINTESSVLGAGSRCNLPVQRHPRIGGGDMGFTIGREAWYQTSQGDGVFRVSHLSNPDGDIVFEKIK